MDNKDNFAIDSWMRKENDMKNIARNLSSEEIDRDLAEVLTEIEFLKEQVKYDFKSYSQKDLKRANEKISQLMRSAEILKIELDRRKNLQ
jgi:hypothetical protein